MWGRIKGGDPILLAGVMGSLLGLYYTKPLCLPKLLVAAIGGVGSALFLSPAISAAADLGYDGACALSFLTGVFSMSLVGVIFQVIDRVKVEPIKTLSLIIDTIIDVLLAFRHGTQPRNRRKDDVD